MPESHGPVLRRDTYINDTNGPIRLTADVLLDGSLGFFGAAAAGQQNVPLTSPTVQDVIDALIALGLVEQSD